jgi:hypothetical protein
LNCDKSKAYARRHQNIQERETNEINLIGDGQTVEIERLRGEGRLF